MLSNTIGNGGSVDPRRVYKQHAQTYVKVGVPRKLVVAVLLIVALIAFELFNYDTTRFALHSLLGEANFAGLAWATVLAVAFCAIDFAGLARLFTPEQGQAEPRAVWYLTGAWLLGATMNAVMTWWAVNLTLLSHDLGNEILGRAELLRFVPIFVAVLVWLTRILFIGAFSIAGDQIFEVAGTSASTSMRIAQHKNTSAQLPANEDYSPSRAFNPQPKSRIRRPRPVPVGVQPVPASMQARGRDS